MTRNEFKTTLNVKRIEIVDLLIACRNCQISSKDGGKKWESLHNKLKKQLNDLDKQLDAMYEIYK